MHNIMMLRGAGSSSSSTTVNSSRYETGGSLGAARETVVGSEGSRYYGGGIWSPRNQQPSCSDEDRRLVEENERLRARLRLLQKADHIAGGDPGLQNTWQRIAWLVGLLMFQSFSSVGYFCTAGVVLSSGEVNINESVISLHEFF